MTAPTFQGQTSFVRQFVAAAKAASTAIIDTSVGSVFLALGQAVTAAALWLQAQAAAVLLLTRAATSSGSDLDSWMADWNFTRLPAVQATGQATFSRATTTQQAVVPIGQFISTGPGGLQYSVTVDATNPAYSAALAGYVIAIGAGFVTVPIQAVLAGAENGNVLANTITSFVSPIPYVDTVTNGSPLANGVDAESDAAFRARFPVYLASLQSADAPSIDNAIENIQQGLQWLKVENFDYPGMSADNGNFFVIVDDGSGNPPSSLLTAITNAINAIRGFTIRFQGAYAPSLIVPNIVLSIRVAAGFTGTTVQAAVQAAVVAAVNAVPLDALTLFISEIEQAALSVPGVQAVKPATTTINAVQADLAMTIVQRPRITTSNVSAGTY